MHQAEQRAARLEAHVRYLQYKDIIGRIRWLEGVVYDAGLDTEGNWARYYEDYDHEADWDAWIDNEVRGDVEESTSSGETSSDSSDSDTGTAPLPDRLRLGKRKRTQVRAEARRRKSNLRTRDTEPNDNNDEVKLVDPCAKWESSSDSSGWFTPVTDEAHFGYVNGTNQINWPGDSTPLFISGSPIQPVHWFDNAHSTISMPQETHS